MNLEANTSPLETAILHSFCPANQICTSLYFHSENSSSSVLLFRLCWAALPVPELTSLSQTGACLGPWESVLGKLIVRAGCGGRLLGPVQPCRARRSQSLLLGVELERSRASPSAFPAQLAWAAGRAGGREESCARSPSVRLPRQHRWSSPAGLGAQPSRGTRYRPVAACGLLLESVD